MVTRIFARTSGRIHNKIICKHPDSFMGSLVKDISRRISSPTLHTPFACVTRKYLLFSDLLLYVFCQDYIRKLLFCAHTNQRPISFSHTTYPRQKIIQIYWKQISDYQALKEVSQSNNKLDGVGPIDNRPSPDKLHHFVIFFYFFLSHLTPDT